MADRFFFDDYLTQKRMNDWMAGQKKILSQLITHHICAPRMAFENFNF